MFHSLHVLQSIIVSMPLFKLFDVYSKVWNLIFVFGGAFLIFLGYCHIYETYTTAQNIILVWTNIRGWFNIHAIDIIFCMTCSFILVRTICIYFVNVIIFFYPGLILLNTIFQKLFSFFLYVLIYINLTQAASYIQI